MSLQKSEVQIKPFFFNTAPSVPTSLYSSPPLPLFPFCSLLSSLLCNDHSSALQEPVPFSTACSLIQPALGSSAPVCSSLGGGPHCPSSSQMTTIFHARERPEAFPIMPVWNLSRNSLAHIIMNYISFHFLLSWYTASPLCQRQTKPVRCLAEIKLNNTVSSYLVRALYSSPAQVYMFVCVHVLFIIWWFTDHILICWLLFCC